MKQLKVYTTKTCAYCPMVKAFLDYRKVPYNVVEVDDDPDMRTFLQSKTGLSTVPVTTNGDKYVAGYNIANLMELINA